MKEYKRLAAAAQMGNHPNGYLELKLIDFDGGEFGLHPRLDETGVYLLHPSEPGYRLKVTAESPATLERFAKALLASVRLAKTGDDADSDEE